MAGKSWLDWLKIAGGVGLEFVPGMQGVGTGLIGSGIASMASNKATDQLQQAGNQALDLQRQQVGAAQSQIDRAGQIQQQLYQDSINRLTPYTSLANGALGLLGQGLGVSVQQPSSQPSPLMARQTISAPIPPLGQPGLSPVKPGNAQGIVTNPMGPTLTPNGLQYLNGQQQPSSGQTGQRLNTLADVGAAMQRGSSYSVGQQGQTVTMEAPDGSRMPVPAAQVQTWLQRGAKVVR